MDQGIKSRWLAQLRLPGMRQGTGQLRNYLGQQCCLDVLCDLAVADGIIAAPQLPTREEWDQEIPYEDYAKYAYHYTDEAGNDVVQEEVLPEPVIKWAGLENRDPLARYTFMDDDGTEGSEFVHLSELNDDYGLSFYQIADCIENTTDL